MEPPEQAAPPVRRKLGLVVLVLLVGGLIWVGFAIAPSVRRSAAAGELQRRGFEAGAKGNSGAPGFKGWWQRFRKSWQQAPDPKAHEWKYRVRLMSKPYPSLDPFVPALLRFETREILLGFCHPLCDVTALKAFPDLQRLDFYDCPNVTDFSVLSHLTKLRELTFYDSHALISLGVIKSGANLVSLHVGKCGSLEDFAALEGFPSLRKLWLNNGSLLKNTEHFRGLSALEEVDLSHSPQLTDVTGLHALPRLKIVRLTECKSLSAEAVAALRAALPAATVIGP